MLRELMKHPTSLAFAIAVHVILIGLLMFSFDWAPKPEIASSKPDIIKAVAVDAAKVEAELQKIRAAEDRKKDREQARLNKLNRDAEQAKKKRASEEKRIADLEKQRVVEEKKRQQEKKQLTEIRKEQAALEKKREAEQKHLTELEDRRKLAEDKKRKAEAEQLKQEELERKRALAKQLEAEEQARSDAAAVNTINEYTALIKNKVSRNWLKPAGDIKGLRCKVSVRLIPGGEVISAQVTRGSGNGVFDRSVESAVFKASPLPLPKDPAIATRMREIDFEFIPEG